MSTNVKKFSSSVSIISNKRETLNSTACQLNANVLKAKTVNAVNDGSNIVCVSCGKDVFMLSHEKCVARHALLANSRVKRAFFTSPVATKSRKLGATSVVAKSRFSFAKTSKVTNKVSSASSLSPESNQRESLTSVYERLTTLVNVMDRNNIRPIPISINNKFLNSLQPEWSKYVTMTRQNNNLKKDEFDHLFDALSQYEPHVNASKLKKAARNHDPLALVAHSNVYSSHSHASPSYSHTPKSYYVTHPSSVIDYEEDYQGELQGDAQEDKLTTAMMLLARAITQKFSTPTNNRLRTSSNTRNQVVIQDGRIDIQSKNGGYAGNGNRNAGRQNRTLTANAGNGLVQQIDENDQIIQQVPRTESNLVKANVQCYNCNARDEHDSNAHDQYLDIQSLVYNVQKEAKNQQRLNNELKRQKMLLQKELETCKGLVKTLEKKPVHFSKYIEAYEELEREISVDKNTMDRLLKQKDKIEGDFFKLENENVKIRYETKLSKKAFKERENKYLYDIVDLKEKLRSHDRIVYKIKQSIQTIHMLKKPNKLYDPFLKARLGYQNPKRIKKAIVAQPKMYDGERIHSTKLKIDSPDSEETLEDAEES
ncbi:hypothetical protein Tco_0178423 [Tanacetum coccineum]